MTFFWSIHVQHATTHALLIDMPCASNRPFTRINVLLLLLLVVTLLLNAKNYKHSQKLEKSSSGARQLLQYHYPVNQSSSFVFYPWPNVTVRDSGLWCGGFSVAFAQSGTVPPIALASRPGSGNTWLRYLIQGATGIFTGDVYQVSIRTYMYLYY